MAVINPPAYLQNVSTYTAQVDRIAAIGSALMPASNTGLTWRDGVRGIGDLKVTAQGTPNMTVNVSAGTAFVLGSTSTTQGVYVVPNDATLIVTIPAAHASLGRNDLIVARIQDATYAGSVNTGTIEVVSGTASASPVDPTVPASCLILARVFVGAAVSSITSGVITDLRKWTASPGGTLPCLSTARPSHQQALMIYEVDTNRIYVSDGTNWIPYGQPGGYFTYTPTFINFTATVNAARYAQVGKHVTGYVKFTLTNTPTGTMGVTLPNAPNSAATGTQITMIGQAGYLRTANAFWQTQTYWNSSLGSVMSAMANGGIAGGWPANQPATIQATDVMHWTFDYEAA